MVIESSEAMQLDSLSPNTTARRRIIWLLRATIAIQAVGIAAQFYFAEFETESPLFSYLLYEREWTQEAAQRVDDIIACGWLLAGLAILLLPLLDRYVLHRPSAAGAEMSPTDSTGWATRWETSLEFLLLAFVFLLQIIHVTATWHRGTGERFNDLVPLEQVARWMTPVLLAILLPVAGRTIGSGRFHLAMWLLRATASITFLAHGIKAIGAYPPFVDYLLVAANLFLGWDASEASMTTLLRIIGWIDVAVAILLVTRRWRVMALYMTLWAIVGALARVVHSGLPSSFEVAIRSGNYCLPLAVLLYFHCTRRAKTGPTNAQESLPPTDSTETSEEIDDGEPVS